MSIGRWAVSWAASTRIRPPAAWTRAARSCTGGTTPVTLEAPVTASSATRPAWRASRRSRSSSSSVPSGRAPTATVRGPGPPREVVGVVLEPGGEHHRVRLDGQRARQQVDRVGRVPPEHHDVPLGVRPHEVAHHPPGLLVGRGAGPGLVARAAVHAGVQGQERRHRVRHRPQGRRRRRVVEVHVGDPAAPQHRDGLVDADDLVPWDRALPPPAGRGCSPRPHRPGQVPCLDGGQTPVIESLPAR